MPRKKPDKLSPKPPSGTPNNADLLAAGGSVGVEHNRRTNTHALPRWSTMDARRRMAEEFNYDPLAEMIAIARGEAITTDHPFLPILLDALAMWVKVPPTERQINKIAEQARRYLTDSWVPHDIRARANNVLLDKVYPQAKAVEVHHSGNINHDIAIKPISREEAVVIEATFEALY